MVVVASEKLAADEATWAACSAHAVCASNWGPLWAGSNGDNVFTGIYRHTLSQLALDMARPALAAGGAYVAGSLALEAIVALIVNRARNERTLRYFGPVADRPRFARALLATLTELRLENIEPEQLRTLEGAPADLALLMDAFEAELHARDLADLPIAMRTAADVLAAGRHPYCGAAVLLLCPGMRHHAERELIKALSNQARAVLSVSTEDEEARQLAAIFHTTPEQLDLSQSSTLHRVQSRLFTFASHTPLDADDSFEMFAAPSEALECVEIARRVLNFAAEDVPFDRMAIFLRAGERYSSVLAEAFDRAQIPLWRSEGLRRPHPAGRALLALLHFANEGFPAARFLEYLSLGQSPPQRAVSPGQTYAPAYWERLINDANIIRGADRWRRRLEWLAREVDAQPDNAAAEALAALHRFASPILDRLEHLPATANWGVWLDQLSAVAQLSIAKPDRLIDILDDLTPLADIARVTLEDVLLALEPRLRDYRPHGRSRRHGCVFAGDAASARGMSFDIVFIPGLSEGSFPRGLREDPLLLDESRRKISPRLACSDHSAEHTLLRSAIAAAERRVIASYARMDLLSGRARVPSLYFFELASAAAGGALDVRRLEETARANVETQAGWPAPHDPLQAIDDGEFDLATLGPALDQPETAPALGAYLTRLESPLAEALRARWAKWDRNKWRSWDGFFDTNGASILAPFLLDQHVYSASLLEGFAACPYRFYLSAIQRLTAPDRRGVIHKMPADVRGRIFHAAAFRYVRAVLDGGLEDLDAKLAAADAAVTSVASEYEELLSPALPAVWNRGVETIRADLRSWIVEHEWSSPNWRPIAAELSFGKDITVDCDPASTPEPVNILDAVLLRGSIDLIEANGSGDLRVIDHKTGKPQRYRTNLHGDKAFYELKAVGAGEVLQPLLYGIAAEALSGRTVSCAKLSYSTQRGELKQETVGITQPARRALAQVLAAIDEMLRVGELPAAPRPGACLFCEYRPICGPYEEERAARKQPVATLERLRILD